MLKTDIAQRGRSIIHGRAQECTLTNSYEGEPECTCDEGMAWPCALHDGFGGDPDERSYAERERAAPSNSYSDE